MENAERGKYGKRNNIKGKKKTKKEIHRRGFVKKEGWKIVCI